MTVYNPAEVERLVREARELADDDQDGEFPFPDGRATELGERLTAPGPKACAVSASECHEITEFLFNAYDHDAFPVEARKALRAMADQLEAARARIAGLEHDLRNAQQRCIALEHASETLAAENAEAKGAILRQAARLAALESELATLQAKVVAAMSSAGPEGAEDERAT